MGRLLSKDVLRVTMRSALGVAILGGACQVAPAFAQSSEPSSEKQSATTLPEVRVAGQRAQPRRAARVAPAPVQPVPAPGGRKWYRSCGRLFCPAKRHSHEDRYAVA